MTPLIKSLVSLTPEAADYVWFDMGTIARYSIDWKRTQPNLPFERVAICGRDKFGDRFLVLCDHADDNTFLVAAWSLLNTHYTKTPMFAAVVDPDVGGVYIAQVDGENEVTKETAAPIMGIVCEFLMGVNPEGYAPTVKNSHINRTRAKKGKPPLQYTWKTITIEPPKQKAECLGGTHPSPRKHQRRGHWRNHPTGKKVWVRDCWVGDAAKGMVYAQKCSPQLIRQEATMNDLIKLAREVGAAINVSGDGLQNVIHMYETELQQFTQRYRAQVLLEAAKVCDDIADGFPITHHDAAKFCATRLMLMAEQFIDEEVQNG